MTFKISLFRIALARADKENTCLKKLPVIESSEEVASSKIRIGESFRIALAMLTLCFSPPESFRPRSPT